MNAFRNRIADWLLALSDWVASDPAALVDEIHEAIHRLDDEDPITTWHEHIQEGKHRGRGEAS